jgi:hypothetical protein
MAQLPQIKKKKVIRRGGGANYRITYLNFIRGVNQDDSNGHVIPIETSLITQSGLNIIAQNGNHLITQQ